MNEKVTLGSHELDVYPQRHAYLTNRLGKFVSKIIDSDTELTDGASVLAMLGDGAYDLFVTLIPQYGQRCPLYEYMGYASQEAYEKQEYDEVQDKSPTFPQMVSVFETAAIVNRFDTLKVLGQVFDPKLLRGWINQRAETALDTSVSLPSAPAGADPLMSSGTTPPTLTVSEGLQSPDSKNSSEDISNELNKSATS